MGDRRMTTPLTDHRPFKIVLADWIARHGLSDYAAAKLIGAKDQRTIPRWREGAAVTYEPAIRAAMTLHDEGRL